MAVCLARLARISLIFVMILAGTLSLVQTTLAAQQPSANNTATNPDKLTVNADELVYDTDKNTVSARGNAKLYYQGKVLEADQVIYHSDTGHVFAEGHVILTETDGQILHATSLELSEQFRDGFINSFKLDTPDNTHFVAPRGERISSTQTIFEKGTFTACDACKEDPSKPPLWQVRARRIIHNQVEKVIYYEDAMLDIGGVPVMYMPYFSAPDNTIPRRSGFLTPLYTSTSTLGQGVAVPYYYVISPDRDMTVTPTLYSRQGILLEGEYRQKLDNGDYIVRLGAISQNDRSAFLSWPYGAGNLPVRGYVETAGKININSQWNWGWDLAYSSDKWFYQNYRIDSPSVTSLVTIKRESTSTAFLQGKGDHSFFDGRGYYFQSLLTEDNQLHQPLILPVMDYDRRFHLNGPIAGELALTTNLTNVSRLEADIGSLNSSCVTPYSSTNCYMRGVGGNYSRYTAEIAWRRSFIDPVGQSWTPFASFRGDTAYTTLFNNGDVNSSQSNLIDAADTGLARSMQTVGVTYRYPFIASSKFGNSVFEPIVQVISRPNETNIAQLPNEDSQSLVFDDTNLFAVDKFSGYDRIEGGSRANVGGQFTVNMNNGSRTNFLVGQSYQLNGLNSFAQRDLALAGADSGLDKTTSDYVSRLQFMPNKDLNFTLRGRFDPQGVQSRRFEAETSAQFGRVGTSLIYANYDAQPNAGILTRREGVGANASYAFDSHWSLSGGALYSLSRYLTDSTAPHDYLASYSTAATYHDECTDFSVQFIGKDPLATGTTDSGQTIFFRLSLRTLGTIDSKTSVNTAY
ncbi:MAG: LPS-assembly protein LptD [Beijerinckiaceae bacterium]|nr:LPS-assembly protein LptD [Beijerinckiaceae bacterium]